jgi:hypothetical protein
MQFVGPLYSRRVPAAEGVPAVVGQTVISPIPERKNRHLVSSSPITAPRVYQPHELQIRLADEERARREIQAAKSGLPVSAVTGGEAWDPYSKKSQADVRGQASQGYKTITSERKTPLTLTEMLDRALGEERETVAGVVRRTG